MVETVEISTRTRTELVDVTREIERLISQSGVKEGICHIYVPHTTAGIVINEHADPSVATDIAQTLDKLVPRGPGYHHMEGNADSHVKASIVGSSVTVIIEGGRLLLGTWQGVFFCEFDGPRRRSLLVKISSA